MYNGMYNIDLLRESHGLRKSEVTITEAIVELARAGQGIAVLAGWVFNDLESVTGLTAVRITRRGFT